MPQFVWLLLLAIPPWIVAELGAPKWGIGLAIMPFFLFAMTLDDPDEDLLGDASGSFRKGVLFFIAAGGLALGGVIWALSRVLF